MTRIPVEWIDRYFAGESSPDESARVRDWLAADARHRVFAEALSTAGRDERAIPSVRGVAATWARVAQRTTQNSAQPIAPQSAPLSTPRVAQASTDNVSPAARWHGATSWLAATAAACCVALAAVMAVRASKPMDLLSHTYTTAAGQRATILLPDGSTVTLAPQTTLSVAFSSDERRLTLAGQAYFDVVKATGAPFVVRAGHVDTRVMGTAFDIRHYAGDPVVQVGVVSGKVAVAGRLGHVLTAGMVGRFADSSDVVTSQAPDVAWTRGALVFRDTPLPDALATLSRWYGIELRMADSVMASWHVTGTFAGDSRSEALTTLRTALSVTLTYLGAPGQVPVVTLVQRHGKRTTDRDGIDRRKLEHFTDTSREVGR